MRMPVQRFFLVSIALGGVASLAAPVAEADRLPTLFVVGGITAFVVLAPRRTAALRLGREQA